MNNFALVLIYSLLGMVYFYGSLRLWNKGRKNIVNLDSGNLMLYAILTTIFALVVTYLFANSFIESIASKLGSMAGLSFVPIIGMTRRRQGFLDIAVGRGTFSNNIWTYLPETALMLIGVWMIGNKDDALTKWGMGIFAFGFIWLLLHLNIFAYL
ncbi:hypothetical protein B6U81_01760 [Thermoplasmatales archaeon ex4484_30]|nr:MAG: hypothetical protein B6U81_01760 [Thermoplasmatales archaeon ex4484_30]